MEDQLAKRIRTRFESLREKRRPWETLWQDIANYVMPRRAPGIIGSVQSPSTDTESRLFDTTAVQANMTLANGQLAWMSPMESPWFSFEPQGRRKFDDAKLWLSDATTEARDALASSNFYEAVHEFYLDRGAFGTAALYVEPGKKKPLNCKVWPVGTFVIDEDEEGDIDTVIREFELTARQAVAKFGEDKVHPKVAKRLKQGGTHQNDKIKFLHAIYPREDAERDKVKLDAENMRIASVYVDLEHTHTCHQGGYEEMPVMVSRYLQWGTGMGSLYGWSPSFAALPEARQLNFLQKMMDALAEKMAFPPVLAPEELEGEIDPNAYGVTYFSSDLQGAMPKEWMTAGRYDVGLQRVQERQQAIDTAFHVDLFKMFSQIQKQMTATEVAERSAEKLVQFSPTFARLTGELFNPLLERVFNILLRLGRFEEVPEDLGEFKITYASRIALALRTLPSIGYARTLERLGSVAQINPDVVDNYDFDKAERATALTSGMPAEFMRTISARDEMRNGRAEVQAAEQQAQQASMAADAASKLGQVPPDSAVGEAIEQQIGMA